MPQKVRIALDAMGGDHGPSVVVPGAAVALAQHPGASFILFGDQAKIDGDWYEKNYARTRQEFLDMIAS